MENTTPAPPPPDTAVAEDKATAVLAYLTLIGFLAAVIIHWNKKTRLGAFHLQQALGFHLTCIVAGFCDVILAFIPVVGWVCLGALWLALLVLWISGLTAALRGQRKPMPLAGPLFQEWFAGLFD